MRCSFSLLGTLYRRCIHINDLMINEEIRDREVRVVDQNGEQLGVMPIRQALEMAEEQQLDLVKIAPQAKPPVCKIMDSIASNNPSVNVKSARIRRSLK